MLTPQKNNNFIGCTIYALIMAGASDEQIVEVLRDLEIDIKASTIFNYIDKMRKRISNK